MIAPWPERVRLEACIPANLRTDVWRQAGVRAEASEPSLAARDFAIQRQLDVRPPAMPILWHANDVPLGRKPKAFVSPSIKALEMWSRWTRYGRSPGSSTMVLQNAAAPFGRLLLRVDTPRHPPTEHPRGCLGGRARPLARGGKRMCVSSVRRRDHPPSERSLESRRAAGPAMEMVDER